MNLAHESPLCLFFHPRLRAGLIPLTLLFDLIPEPAGLAGENVAVVLLGCVPGAGVHFTFPLQS